MLVKNDAQFAEQQKNPDAEFTIQIIGYSSAIEKAGQTGRGMVN